MKKKKLNNWRDKNKTAKTRKYSFNTVSGIPNKELYFPSIIEDDYNENLTDEHFRINQLRKNDINDGGWTTVKKVNKKEEMEKERREKKRQKIKK